MRASFLEIASLSIKRQKGTCTSKHFPFKCFLATGNCTVEKAAKGEKSRFTLPGIELDSKRIIGILRNFAAKRTGKE